MIPIGFILTEVDLIAASQLAMLRTYNKNAFKYIVILVGVAALVSCVIAIFNWEGWMELAISFGILLAIYGGLIVLATIFSWTFFIKWRSRKNFRQIAALGREQCLRWNEHELEVTSSQGISRFPYDEIHQWAANDTTIIIYPADHLFFPFPVRIFESAAQCDDFVASLSASSARRI
jgi:hypothetical protein